MKQMTKHTYVNGRSLSCVVLPRVPLVLIAAMGSIEGIRYRKTLAYNRLLLL